MPVVRFENDRFDPFWVQAVMNFPNDANLRQSYFAHKRIDFEVFDQDDSELINVDVYTLRLLLNSPSKSELKSILGDNFKRAMVAGDVLAIIYLMDKFHLKEPSIRKACFVCQQFAKQERFYGDGAKMAISVKTIMDTYWPEFKSVAHFWAALRINYGYEYCPPERIFDIGFDQFLSVAKELQEFGKTFVPFRLKPAVPILHGVELWELSSDVVKMPLMKDATFPALLKEFLDKYRA